MTQPLPGLPGALQFFLRLVFRNYMNDSLRTDVFVRFQPESIACACIYLAARTLEVSAVPPRGVRLASRRPPGSCNVVVFRSPSLAPISLVFIALGARTGIIVMAFVFTDPVA